jgi:hypothetical protein
MTNPSPVDRAVPRVLNSTTTTDGLVVAVTCAVTWWMSTSVASGLRAIASKRARMAVRPAKD